MMAGNVSTHVYRYDRSDRFADVVDCNRIFKVCCDWIQLGGLESWCDPNIKQLLITCIDQSFDFS